MKIQNKFIKTITQVLIFAAVVFVFFMPLLRLLAMSMNTDAGWGLDNYSKLFVEERTIQAIKNTILIAMGSTSMALLLGGALAFVVAYTNVKRKKAIEFFILSQFVIPSYIVTLSWSNLLQDKGLINQTLDRLGLPTINIYSLGGIIFVLGLCSVPIVYMITVNMLRKIPKDLEWASRVAGYSQWETLVKISLPQIMPALMSGGMLAFLASMDNFSVPAFLGISSGIPVLSTAIYEKAISFGPQSFAYAAALAVILSLIAVTGTGMQSRLVRKSSHMESIREDYSVRIEMTERKRRMTEWGILGLFSIVTIIPLLSMMISSFLKFYGIKVIAANITLKNYAFVFTNRGVMQAVRNSLLLAAVTCIICIAAGTLIAYLKLRSKRKTVLVAEAGASLTYAIPGIVLSLAMIFHWSKVPNTYGTIRILLIAYVTRYLILQIKGSTTALMAVHPSLEEASSVAGSSKPRTWVRIMIPLIAKPILGSTFFIFVSSMTELTLSSMLAAAGTKTIGLTIFSLQQGGDFNLSAAMSMVIVIMIGLGYFAPIGAGALRRVLHDGSRSNRKRAVGGSLVTQQIGGEQ